MTLLICVCFFSPFFCSTTLTSGHLSSLNYSPSWRTEHQKSPLWRSRTLFQRSCITLWYNSRLSYLLNLYFLLPLYCSGFVIMTLIFFWAHCRKKSSIQTWSCVPSWLWLLSPSVPAQYSSPSRSVEAGSCSCYTFLRLLGGVQWEEGTCFIFMMISFFSFSFLSLHSPLLASSCISWPELSASLPIISSLSSESSSRGSAWLTLCCAPESTASLRSEVSVILI